MNRILLVESSELNPYTLRVESRRAGVCLLYERAESRDGYMRLLARHPALVVTTLQGVADLDFEELAQAARSAEVPVLVVGGDTEEERKTLRCMRELYTYTCHRNRMGWLPVLLERAVREAEEKERRHRPSGDEVPAELLRAAEQVREVQRLATIGRLTGSIVHEINNPLESVTNLVYLMNSDDQLPAHMRPYLDLVQGELQRVAQISRQTLTFCRETQSMIRVDISSLLQEVLALYTRRINEKRLEIERRFEEEEPVLVYPGEMRQVYSNLVANAIEATEPGGRIVIRLHRSTRWNGKDVRGMRVLIADTGCGIPNHVRAKLGQPFFTTKGQRGTGLGLWVSRAILQRYGAEMRLRSSVDPAHHGTTFSVFVPFVHRPRVVEIGPAGSTAADVQVPAQPGPESAVESVEVVRLRAGIS